MKEKKTNCGIYRITNLIPNKETGICKVYIGSSENLKSRKCQHLWYLRHNKHTNKHLQRAFIIDKEENFKWELIKKVEKIEDKKLLKKELLKWENIELKKYKKEDGTIDHDKCYNFLPIAGSNLGSKKSPCSEETKIKIGKGNKNKIRTEETRNKIRKNSPFKLKVINLTTGEIFESTREAARFYNISSQHISRVCRGEGFTCNGHEWSYLDSKYTKKDRADKPKNKKEELED